MRVISKDLIQVLCSLGSSRWQTIRACHLVIKLNDIRIARQLPDRSLQVFAANGRGIVSHKFFEFCGKFWIRKGFSHGFSDDADALFGCSRREYIRPAWILEATEYIQEFSFLFRLGETC